MTKKDGGPAFPFQASEHEALQRGMSLRDWFAGRAMAAMVGNSDHMVVFAESADPAKDVAVAAYSIADAMLAEREDDDD